MSSESRAQSEILLVASKAGYTLFRNNTGLGWIGDSHRLPNDDVLIRNARPLHAGLCTGSADLIGWRPTLILPEHVGTILGVFVAVEVKAPRGLTTPEQANFLARVREAGGVGVVARGPEDLPK